MSLAAIYAGEMLKHAEPSARTFSSKKHSVLKIVLVISIFMGYFPKLFPNVCLLICYPVVLFICYHSGVKTWNAKDLGGFSLKGKNIVHCLLYLSFKKINKL